MSEIINNIKFQKNIVHEHKNLLCSFYKLNSFNSIFNILNKSLGNKKIKFNHTLKAENKCNHKNIICTHFNYMFHHLLNILNNTTTQLSSKDFYFVINNNIKKKQ